MEYKINKEDYKKMLSKFYFYKFKWLLIFAFIAVLFGTYCLFVGIFADNEAFEYVGYSYGFSVLLLLVYIVGTTTYKRQSLSLSGFNNHNEVECRMERQDNIIKIFDITNDSHSTTKIEDITKILIFKDKIYAIIICENKAFIVKNNEIIENIKKEIENK